MALTFAAKELFGGAILASVPSTWMDMSDIRQVPDNQESFIDTTGFGTLIFELNERVDQGDEEASIKFHLSDIFEDDAYKIWQSRKLDSGDIPGLPDVPAYSMLITTPYVEKRRHVAGHPSQFVALAIVIVRLEKQKTDIVITANMPHSLTDAQAEKSLCCPGLEADQGFAADHVWKPDTAGPALKKLLEIIEQAVKGFVIRDWDLFVTEDAN
ncbi:hypothetical protein DRE_02354 [Drechslerella stenobrocha 248]|uniref:Ran-interacting Mog1 protein n=1 Tax=Drechslerella stenobrocha 248 TaxID=1043628 RepID=W7IGE1_9PEZI|nr:hypothetical protein DRE_02354 [Drechslerella stenobrocha 248]